MAPEDVSKIIVEEVHKITKYSDRLSKDPAVLMKEDLVTMMQAFGEEQLIREAMAQGRLYWITAPWLIPFYNNSSSLAMAAVEACPMVYPFLDRQMQTREEVFRLFADRTDYMKCLFPCWRLDLPMDIIKDADYVYSKISQDHSFGLEYVYPKLRNTREIGLAAANNDRRYLFEDETMFQSEDLPIPPDKAVSEENDLPF